MLPEGVAMANVIRVLEEFGDGSDALLLNPSGTRVAVFTYDRDAHRRHTLTVYSTLDNQCVAEPLELGDCRGIVFIDDETLLILDERRCLRYQAPANPKVFAS